MSGYGQYLGAKRCCDLKVQGPQGPQGAQGPSAVGSMGYQGATGALGYQGATGRGCRGATGAQGYQGEIGPAGGPQGATGASQWISMNGVGQTGGGYTGIGITGQDVLIYGNLLVTGGIDPTYLALTPQPSGPQGFTNPLWLDTSGNLRTESILVSVAGSTGSNTITKNDIIFNGVSILPQRFFTNSASVSVAGIDPTTPIWSITPPSGFIAGSYWKIDLAFMCDFNNPNAFISYAVYNTVTTNFEEEESCFGFTQGFYYSPLLVNDFSPPSIGRNGATLTDCFKIKATAGAGPFYLQVIGGTSNNTAWIATASINLTLTRVNPY